VLRRPTTAVISNSDASYLMPSDVVSALLEVYHDDDILCVQTEPNGDFAVTFS
jgi:chromatin segregation and condensation protein Rec8/ScpA/Scc1 (kleisin family)